MPIEGLITAMVTPMNNQFKIDSKKTKALVERLIKKGVDGLFILGTNGEFHVISEEEKVKYVEMVVSYVKGRVPVYAGSGGNSTEEVILLSNRFAKAGVQAVSVITPYLVQLSQQELRKHYEQIADQVTVPVILYNIPKNTGNNLEPETVRILASHPNIAGIKDSSGNLEQIRSYCQVTENEEFAVLCGSDSLIYEGMKAGAKGAVAATSNLLTDLDVDIVRQVRKGCYEEAMNQQARIEELRKVLKKGSVPSVLKAAMNLAGVDVGDCRYPVIMPNKEIQEDIVEMLKYYKLREEDHV